MEKLSVIICTYNPDSFIFSRCLEAIQAASIQYRPFEIIIVDNNSFPALNDALYIQEFLRQSNNTRIVIETKQGLTPARLSGIKEATGDILAFIDDDNWIKPDFFQKGMDIAENYPYIGSWSGQVKLHFEKEPEAWTKKYWGLLVYREFTEDKWSNFPHFADTMPCGAGLFVRKKVADYYCYLHDSGKRNIQLDRNGNSFLSGGDNDLAACACDIGLGVGLFHKLVLDHYIPSSRVTKKYLLKLAEGIYASAIVFKSFRGELPQKHSLKKKIIHLFRIIMSDATARAFLKAVYKGEKQGIALFYHTFRHNTQNN